jgi:hypothetical protein
MIPERPGTTLVVIFTTRAARYRGYQPAGHRLIEGDAETGVNRVAGGGEYDRGDILGQVTVPLPRPIRIAAAIDLIAVTYGRLATRSGRGSRPGSR